MTDAAPASPIAADEDAFGPRDISLPAEPVLDDEQCGFIASSSLVFVMSGAPDVAPDVSPRGDLPGFVKVVDRRYLLMPDRVGNNRVDTIRNVVQDPRVALVFMKARDERILVVDGTAVNRT
ncbi:pyridoxamine 5'-phosphate oxidase family protein, partial [Rhizobiaceae sp. 2RAB30]